MERTMPRILKTARRRDAAEAEVVGLRREIRALELRAARHFAEVERAGHFVFRGCSSIAHFGERHGYAGREARRLAAVGKVLRLEPSIEARVLDGRLSLDSAAALLRILGRPRLLRDGDDWVAWAERWSADELERKIRERAVEVGSGEPASTLTATVTASGRLKFERAHQLASRKKRRTLTDGETLEVLADHYLDSFDPLRREPRLRRMPSTKGRPGRHVPAAVARTVLERQGDRCSVPGCDHRVWVQTAHLFPHRRGGSREASNLVRLCWMHHWLYDWMMMRITGTADNPIFIAMDGDVIREPAPSPYAGRAPPEAGRA